jgi:predicted glycosyltransferase
MVNKKKLMYYCQHVLGMGHFVRSVEIIRALTPFEVYFLNGGEMVPGFDPPPEVEVINLPPIKSDSEFREIRAVDSSTSLDEIKEIRKKRILGEFERVRPELLVIELFPFGRLKFDFELIPLLELARAGGRTKVVCSLRDILVSKREQRQFEEDACRIVNQYFDLILIHSDPRFHRLEETFPRAGDLKCPIRYTGFVAQPVADHESLQDSDLEKDILVSIGGGRVGVELIDCAMDASALIADKAPHRMSIFTGPYLADSEFGRLEAKIAGNRRVKLQRYTTEFVSSMRAADLSMSMAGYNTCMNIIVTGTRAIVYPFSGNNNQEQTIRAKKLRELGLVEVIEQGELRPATLADKILAQLTKPKPMTKPGLLDLNGATNTVAALIDVLIDHG